MSDDEILAAAKKILAEREAEHWRASWLNVVRDMSDAEIDAMFATAERRESAKRLRDGR
jgi:hypothetical protein